MLPNILDKKYQTGIVTVDMSYNYLETYINLKILISELKIHLTRQRENGQIPA